MSEQQIPTRIWAGPFPEWSHWSERERNGYTPYVRSDIAERMAEALEAAFPILKDYDFPGALPHRKVAYDKVRGALSAFRDATQDTENSR